MFSQLKDAKFKKIMLSLYGESQNLFFSDYSKKIGDTIYIVEYENSSRGMTSNLAKLLRLVGSHKCKILFIRTDIHAGKHHADYKNFNFIKSMCNKNISIKSINGCDFVAQNNLIDNFK